jgi:hypothetical protein
MYTTAAVTISGIPRRKANNPITIVEPNNQLTITLLFEHYH